MKAIFFDRDGVLVKPVYHHEINRSTAPWKVEELELYDITPLKKLTNYALFLISNQPDAARGRTSLKDLQKIACKFNNILQENNIYFIYHYYCYHDKGCLCRKPSPYFIIQASIKYNLNLMESYMIGDQDTDILCGQSMSMKTLKITEDINTKTNNLTQIVELIL